MAATAAILAAIVAPTAAAAGDRAGDLDASFGSGGSVATTFSAPEDGISSSSAVAVQSDGKIIQVGGATFYGSGGSSNTDFAVVRLNPDGSPDQGFNASGKVVTDIGTPADAATAVTLQPDGKILVAGQEQAAPAGPENLVVVRYTSDGQLDPSFGMGGIAIVSDPGFADFAYAIAVDANGGIVVAGLKGDQHGNDPMIIRLDASGVLDPSFGSSGETVINFRGAPENAGAYALAIQADGRIVIGGFTTTWSGDYVPSQFALARVTSDGSLDASFGTGGKVLTAFPGSGADSLTALTLQTDGKIVAVGDTTSTNQNQKFAVARYLVDGQLDPSFGAGGLVSSGLSNDYASGAVGVAIQPDGRIDVGGSGGQGSDFEAARYEPDGSLDPTFGTNGFVDHHVDSNSFADVATGAALEPDGAVIVSGFSGTGFRVVRLLGAPPPSAYVSRTGSSLELEQQPFRPIGLNIYNANSVNNCWYSMDGTILDDSLTAIGPGKNTMRAWFFQDLATNGGARDWTAFDRTLATARAHGYKVIVTLGNQWADCDTGYGYKDTTWYESGYKQPDPAGTVSVPRLGPGGRGEVQGRSNDPGLAAPERAASPTVPDRRLLDRAGVDGDVAAESIRDRRLRRDQGSRSESPDLARHDRERTVRRSRRRLPGRDERPDARSVRVPRLQPGRPRPRR